MVNFGPDLFMIQAIQNQPIISRIGQGTFTGFGVIRTITSLCWFLISSNIVAKEAPAPLSQTLHIQDPRPSEKPGGPGMPEPWDPWGEGGSSQEQLTLTSWLDMSQ